MGVSIPTYNLKASRDLPELRRRLKGGNRKAIAAELTLTSLIDIFSVVILFLIQGFSATGEVFMINEKISLPTAAHGDVLFRSPIVTVLKDKITLEGAPVGENSAIDERIEETNWELPLLIQRLEQHRRFFEGVHQNVRYPAEVIIQADRELPFLYLKRVMYSLTKAGFVNVNMAVRGTPNKP
jgi:biopolymer transport protein ExbD